MEQEVKGMKLHGMWASLFGKRVEMALKLKGIPYEYVEEDLMNKSEELLTYNPVHKKVPVLVHHGKPICESLIILEYIDETWKHPPLLLPEDPFLRAKVRFWAEFLDQQVIKTIRRIFTLEGEEQDKVGQELAEKLKMFQEGVDKDFGFSTTSGSPFCSGATPGLLDIVVFSIFGTYDDSSGEISGLKGIDPHEYYPLISKWVISLNEHPVVKEIKPPHEKFGAFLKQIRALGLQSPEFLLKHN